jgi:hypothetical protein
MAKTSRPAVVRLILPGLLLLLASCTNSPTTGPMAWIDAPLDGSLLPLAPQEVIAHGANQAGVAQLEFTVNGASPETEIPADTGDRLSHVKWTWHPPEPGRFTLAVRAQDGDGNWSDPSQVVVTVGDIATPSPTPTTGPTETPTPTASPSPTPTSTSLPGGIAGLPLSTGRVYFGGTSCDPAQVTFHASASAAGGVKVVVFFYRVEDAASGEQTAWSQGEAMNVQGNGAFAITKTGDSLARTSGFGGDGGIVHYQFALQPNQGELVRSPVYTDLQLARCNAITILPPMILVTVTPTVPVIR